MKRHYTMHPAFYALKPETLRVLYRIAKHPTKGVRPFFKDPRAMIALREEIARREVS
jgi:hypothetical protein